MKTEQEIVNAYLELDNLPRINGEAKGAKLRKFLSGLTEAESMFFNSWLVSSSLIKIVSSSKTPAKEKVNALRMYAEFHGLFPEHKGGKNNG
jgi:hypothetical protein